MAEYTPNPLREIATVNHAKLIDSAYPAMISPISADCWYQNHRPPVLGTLLSTRVVVLKQSKHAWVHFYIYKPPTLPGR